MLKISLYQHFCVGMFICINTYDYGKIKVTDRPRTYATVRRLSPRQEPHILDAQSRSIFDIHRSDLEEDRIPNGNEPYISQLFIFFPFSFIPFSQLPLAIRTRKMQPRKVSSVAIAIHTPRRPWLCERA